MPALERALRLAELRLCFAAGCTGADATVPQVNGRRFYLCELYLIDRKGVIRETLIGYGPSRGKKPEKLVTRLLAEK